jgi:hypothetical protein
MGTNLLPIKLMNYYKIIKKGNILITTKFIGTKPNYNDSTPNI